MKTMTAKTHRLALLMTGVVLMACGGGTPEAGPADAPAAAGPAASTSVSAAPSAVAGLQPPDFSGTYDVTAVVSSIGFLGSLPEPNEPLLTPGTTLEYRVDIACEAAGCVVTTGPLPLRTPNVQVVSSAFVFPTARLIRDGAELSLVGSGSGSPGCDYGDSIYSYRLSGTNPTTVGDRNLFGSFTGSLVNTFERLEGTTPNGSKCYPVAFEVEVTGVRASGATAEPVTPSPPPPPTPAPTLDLVASGEEYLAFASAYTKAQGAASAAIGAAATDAEFSAAYQLVVDAASQGIDDLGRIRLPGALEDERQTMITAFRGLQDIYTNLVADPNDPDPTINTRLDEFAKAFRAASAVIRAALGLPPSSG